MNVNKYGHTEGAWVDLPGSERAEARGLTQSQPVDPNEQATVTLAYRGARPSGALLSYLVAHRLDVDGTQAQYLLKLTGSLANLMAMFETNLTQVADDQGRSFRHRTGPVRVPADVADEIVAVLGLDTRPQARPYFRGIRPDGPQPRVTWTYQQLATVYNLPPGDGSGQSLGFLSLGGGISPNDMGAQGVNLHIVPVDGAQNQYTGNPNSADGENGLDAQTHVGVCPSATDYMILAPNTDQGFVDGLAAMARLPLAAGSVSWGAPASEWTPQARAAIDQVLQSCPFPIFIASGDGGSSDGTGSPVTDYPAESPYAIGCGGTSLDAFQNNTPVEVAWSNSGGGFSRNYRTPSWQPANNQGSGRMVPDVASCADPNTGVPVTLNGQTFFFGGTSEAAPFWAATWARMKAAGLLITGDVHSVLYKAASAIHAVTSGSNGAYQASGQPNPVCGLGSPNGQALLTALQPAPPPVQYSASINGPTSLQAGQTGTYSVSISPPPPAGSIVSYNWNEDSVVSGMLPTFQFTFQTAGAYVLRCTVTVNGQPTTATITVSVTAAPAQPPPPTNGVTWQPVSGDVGTPFFQALIANPTATCDPSTPLGSLLKLILSNYAAFNPSIPSVGQLLAFFLQQPPASLPAEMASAFNPTAQGGAGWGNYLDGKQFADMPALGSTRALLRDLRYLEARGG